VVEAGDGVRTFGPFTDAADIERALLYEGLTRLLGTHRFHDSCRWAVDE
jgi:hypothetical protein